MRYLIAAVLAAFFVTPAKADVQCFDRAEFVKYMAQAPVFVLERADVMPSGYVMETWTSEELGKFLVVAVTVHRQTGRQISCPVKSGDLPDNDEEGLHS